CQSRRRLPVNRLPGVGVEDQAPRLSLPVPAMPAVLIFIEIEGTIERSGNLIERATFSYRFTGGRIDATQTEIVLDEAQYGGLIRYRVVDVIPPREGRDHEERLPW